MRISNLVSSTRQINQEIRTLAINLIRNPGLAGIDNDIDNILQTLQIKVNKTDQLCEKHDGTPLDLPTPSFRAYQWMKFLSQRKWLLTHIYAVKEFYSLLNGLLPRAITRNMSSKLQIDCYHSSYLFRSRQKEGKVYLEINEGFISAPMDIKQTILEAALKRRTAKRLKIIKSYASAQSYTDIHSLLQSNPGANKLAARGQNYDLVEIFNMINEQYFDNQLEQSRLTWSTRRSTRRLGYYHPDSDTITISKRLDSSDIPLYLVEYVMYHEMLHKKIGLKEVNGRRYAHTKKFKEQEKLFKHYKEAEKLIKQLNKA